MDQTLQQVPDDLKPEDPRLRELILHYLDTCGPQGDFNDSSAKRDQFILEIDKLYKIYDPPLTDAIFKDIEIAGLSLVDLHEELAHVNEWPKDLSDDSSKVITELFYKNKTWKNSRKVNNYE